MPEGLPIDHEQTLNGTMAAYAQQILVCTGKEDWTSRIENDGDGEGWGGLVRGLKALLGRGGKYSDVCMLSVSSKTAYNVVNNFLQPYNNILVTNSSFPPAAEASSSFISSAFLFPSFKYFPSIPVNVSQSEETDVDLSTFVRAFLLPEKLNNMHSSLPSSKRAGLTRSPDLASKFPNAIDIKHSPTILICGHGGRDMRCGTIGPPLKAQFQHVLRSRGFSSAGIESIVDRPDHANIGLISHIGGHKYAGNVIIYIPPGMTVNAGGSTAPSPLAGKGIWYGRVEPRHVEGIVEETVIHGRVVTDHFRGGINIDGEILRL